MYIPSPQGFNDRFDAQLHLTHDCMLNIADNYEDHISSIKFVEVLLNYMPLICSFSLNDPMKLNSNIMWGLYGGICSDGFVLSYNIKDILPMLISSHFDVNKLTKSMSINDKTGKINFKKVIYCDKYNPFNAFKDAVIKYFCGDKGALQEFLKNDFLIKKSLSWAHEEEFRLFKFRDIPQEINEYTIKPVNDATCEDLNIFLQNTPQSELCYENFILPSQIILGWGCKLENHNIIELINYAQKNSIDIVKLTGKINHIKQQFEHIQLKGD